MNIAMLAGGTGGAKLAAGFAQLLRPDELTVIANTADDDEFWGLLVSPDVDAILYRLADMFNEHSGFGVVDDTFNSLSMLARLGEPTWFALGDRDIGLHLLRNRLLRSGMGLTEAVAEIARRLGIATSILPMSNDSVRTWVMTDDGELSMQSWFVEKRCAPRVRALRYRGIESARPTPGVVQALRDADAVVIGPSNPLLSIDPIVALLGSFLDRRRVIAVSPIVGGRSLKGPTATMLRDLGEDPTTIGVAQHYARCAETFVIDAVDAAAQETIAALGLRPVVLDTVMADSADQHRLASDLARLVSSLVARGPS